MSLTAAGFMVIYYAGLLASLVNPLYGVLLYIITYHVNPLTQWWGESLTLIGTRVSLTCAVAICLGVALRVPRMEFGQRQFPPPLLIAMAFALVALASLSWGTMVTERGLLQIEKLGKTLLILLLLLRCVRTPLQYHAVTMTWLIGLLYMGYQAWGGAGLIIRGRLTGNIGGPDFAESSDMAVHIVGALPLVGAAFFMARTWLGRSFALVTGALAVNVVIMTRTRNALFGLALAVLVCILHLPRGSRLRGMLAIIAGLGLAFSMTDHGWWDRMETIPGYAQDASALGRLDYWAAALRIAADYPMGIGIGSFQSTVSHYLRAPEELRSCHNTFLECLTETGWVGLILFMLVIGATLLELKAVQQRAEQLPRRLVLSFSRLRTDFHLGWHAVALRAGILGYLGSAQFTTRTYSEDFWLMLGMAWCLSNVSRHASLELAPGASVVSGDALRPLPAQVRPPVGPAVATARGAVR